MQGGKTKKRKQDQDLFTKELIEEQLATYTSLTQAGYEAKVAMEAVMQEGVLAQQDSLQLGISLHSEVESPKLGTSLKIARKKQLFSVPEVGTSKLGDLLGLKSVWNMKKEEAEGSQLVSSAASILSGVKGLLGINEVSQLIHQLHAHFTAQEQVVSELLVDNQKMAEQKELHHHYQKLLKQKEVDLVKKDVEHYKEKQEMEKAKQEVIEVLESMSKESLKNKMSLQLFSDWTKTLQEKMHTELQVLCDSNVQLQVENQILMQRMEPLLSIEKRVIS